jgi:hypothetical protein
MSYGKKVYGGLGAVSSDIGRDLYIKTVIHDDGMKGLGGNRTMCVGDLGSGKTTLALDTVLKICYLPNVKKEDYLKEPDPEEREPETVIWRGRKRDYWNVFSQKNFARSFPKQLWKPLRVMYSIEDDLEFFEDIDGVPKHIETVDFYQYKDLADMYNHLIKGGINVIYAPKEYHLSILLKHTLNDIQLLSEVDRKFIADEDEIHVPNFVFWYDFIYFLIEIDKNYDKVESNFKNIRWLTFIFDEAHQIFPVAKAPLWHLIDHFAENEMIDTRRVNISIWAQVHEVSFVFWKVTNRFNTFIWLPRAKAAPRVSCISQKLINKIPVGTAVIEEKGGHFGKLDFPRISKQPAVLTVKGYD